MSKSKRSTKITNDSIERQARGRQRVRVVVDQEITKISNLYIARAAAADMSAAFGVLAHLHVVPPELHKTYEQFTKDMAKWTNSRICMAQDDLDTLEYETNNH